VKLVLALLMAASNVVQAQLQGAATPLEGLRNAAAVRTPVHVNMVISEAVFNELRALADTARTETVRCLLGAIRGDSAVVDLAWQPPISYADEGYVVFTGCPISTIAQWHNHIRDPRFAPEYACYMSSVDVEAALDERAPPAQIVQVDAETFCWWTRVQIRGAAGTLVLPPVRRQYTGSLRLDASICLGSPELSLGCQLLRGRELQLAGKSN